MMSRTLHSLVLLAALLALTPASHSDPIRGPRFKPNEVFCKLDPGLSIDSVNTLFSTTTKSHQPVTDYYLLNIPQGSDAESLAVAIGQYPGVIYCRPNFLLATPEGLQRSSPFLDLQAKGDIELQPAATTLELSTVHATATGEGITIALIDGGVDFDHLEFARTPGLLVPRWDFVDSDILPADEPGGSSSGHGTFIAGIIKLVAPDADIFVYRVLDTGGVGDGYSIADAIIQAIDDSCQIISLSLGMVGIHEAVDDALKVANQHDITVVASAGNDSTDLSAIFPFPATRMYCTAIAALDSVNIKADFSNYGLKIDLCAPGTWVYGPYFDSVYAWWSGTSFSVPFVVGLHALIADKYPHLTSGQRDSLIFASAASVDSLNPGLEGLLGYGLINPLGALSHSQMLLGDLTGNGFIDLSDLSMLIGYLVVPAVPDPGPRADLNCSGVIDLIDLSTLVGYLTAHGTISCP